MIGRWVSRAARSVVATALTVVAVFTVCVVGGVLVIGAITLASVVVLSVGLGLVYIVTGETGLAQTHAFLEAYGAR